MPQKPDDIVSMEDPEALEAYLNANMEELEEQETEIEIDIDSMMVKGKMEKTQPAAAGSIASNASASNDASKP